MIAVNKENGDENMKNVMTEHCRTCKKFIWFDLRELSKEGGAYTSIIKALSGFESCGVVINEDQLEDIPLVLRKIVFVKEIIDDINLMSSKYDVLIFKSDIVDSEWFVQNRMNIKKEIGISIDVCDSISLQKAVQLTHTFPVVVVEFKDETKIPLEIVLADAQNYNSQVVMKVQDEFEAKVVFGVLECGANGVMLKVDNLHELYSAYEELKVASEQLNQELIEMTVIESCYAGMGDRACIDLTSHLGLDEGLLLGSFSNGGILACSETHPLPYMKTRPFRVNAATLQTYVLATNNQTWYLSDLRAGMELLAVSTNGKARSVTIGRVKIERRPILCITAQAPDNTIVKLFMQADWHVRIFGIDGKPKNITNLKSGDKIVGYTMEPGRHVGVKVDELIIEL